MSPGGDRGRVVGGSRRILGLDPGLVKTGWGMVLAEGSRLRHLASGECASGRGTLGQRLLALERQLAAVVARHAPGEVALEEAFLHRNVRTALLLGQARGVALLAAARAGLPMAEYAPNAVKRTVTGSGHADKRQIQYMVQVLLPGAEPEGEHAADALAVAICHAGQTGGLVAALARSEAGAGARR